MNGKFQGFYLYTPCYLNENSLLIILQIFPAK